MPPDDRREAQDDPFDIDVGEDEDDEEDEDEDEEDDEEEGGWQVGRGTPQALTPRHASGLTFHG